MKMEAEYRDGYLVSEEMKRVWAVELDLLRHFLDYCRRHQLRCWVEGGTLLGAVRHRGFIPWDDDVDLAMPRSDYDRMCQIGNDGIDEPYFLQTAWTDVDYHRGHAQFRRSDTAAIRPSDCFQPFNQGIFIDIFPLDASPDDSQLVHAHRRRCQKLLKFLKAKNTHCFYSGRLTLIFRKLRARYLIHKNGWLYYYRQAEDEMRALAQMPHDYVAELTSLGEEPRWPKHIFDQTIMLPFEDMEVPAPAGYHTFLTCSFGPDYMTPVQAPSQHGSVVFDTARSYRDVLPEVQRDYRRSLFQRLRKKL
jgi:lipopolysaccharide cholinephosphotransferase